MDYVWFWGIATILLSLKLWILELGLIIVTVALCSQISKHLWFSSTLWWPGWYTFWKASDYMIFDTYPTSKNILADGYIVSDFVIKEWLNWVLRWLLFTFVEFIYLYYSIFFFLLYVLPGNLMPFLNPPFGSCKEMRERKLKCSLRWWMIQTDASVSRTQNLRGFNAFIL